MTHPSRPEGADHLGRQTRLVAQEHTLRQGNGFVGESEFVQTFEHMDILNFDPSNLLLPSDATEGSSLLNLSNFSNLSNKPLLNECNPSRHRR